MSCPHCGCTEKWFEFDVKRDEEGNPISFEVTKGPELLGGVGTPDQLVMSTLLMGEAFWKKKGRKNHKKGDYYVSVGMAVAEEIYDYLTEPVRVIVDDFNREADQALCH